MSGYVSGKTSLTTVQTGDIAANAVTLAKMAGGTDGNLITYDASGDPAAVATGSDGQVLTSGGAGVAPTFAAGGICVQVVNTQTGAGATGTTAMPGDDTIPQITEGDEYMTLAFTPGATANILVIQVTMIASTNQADTPTVALFQDSTAGALACAVDWIGDANGVAVMTFTHKMTAGTTSETTFSVRAGGTSGTFFFNGWSASRQLGGNLASSITIKEYTA